MSQGSPPPYNPYLPPQSAPPRREAPRSGTHALTWIYGGLAGLAGLFVGAMWLVDPKIAVVLGSIAGLLALTKGVIGLAWIHSVWSAIDPPMRGDITPGGAVGRLFIPGYNLYWLFHVQGALCNALDRMRVDRGLGPDAPRELAFGASMLFLFTRFGSLLGVPVATVLGLLSSAAWLAYMIRYAQARDAVDRATPADRP